MVQLGFIYKITSSFTDGVYIGSTKNFERRKKEHNSDANAKRYNRKATEITKYDDWKMEKIKTVVFETKEKLEKLETEFQKSTPNCINVVKGYSERRPKRVKEYKKIGPVKKLDRYNQSWDRYENEYLKNPLKYISLYSTSIFPPTKEEKLKKSKRYSKINKLKYYKKNRDLVIAKASKYSKTDEKKEYDRKKRDWENSWGGDKRSSNNLLMINYDKL